ncbi:MAG: hypothetical protein IT450_16820 [Phycisphaerales bacterium]|nr:hypothetical protein [Phycisphaerales bacterium]
MTRRSGPTRKDRQRVQQRIAELLRREEWGELVAMRDRLERRLLCPPPAVDRAAIEAEVDEALEGDETFDFDVARARQGWFCGNKNESVRLVVEVEDPQTEALFRVVERAVVGRIGITRAVAVAAALLAESFSARFPEFEEA